MAGYFKIFVALVVAVMASAGDPRDSLSQTREAGHVFRDCPHCPEMVVVPAGEFVMGSPTSEEGRWNNEGPRHRVMIGSSFAVGVYEVTRGEFGRFVSSTGRSMGDSCWTWENGEWKARSGRGWRNPGFLQTDSHPVVCVSWDDARAYVGWLSGETGASYRLLSESEWEYAARGGTQTRYWWGDGSSSQCRYANGADMSAKKHNSGWTVADCDDGYSRTSPVGSFGANAFGLHDVHGMFGSGLRIAGTTVTPGLRATGALGSAAIVPVAFSAAAPGTATRGTSARRSASGAAPGTGSTTPAFVWPGRSLLESLPLYLSGGPGGLPPGRIFFAFRRSSLARVRRGAG